jgi:membrane fusion protein
MTCGPEDGATAKFLIWCGCNNRKASDIGQPPSALLAKHGKFGRTAFTGGSVSKLFRDRAVAYKADRLLGDVNLATPIGWQLIGYLMLVALIAAGMFFSLGSYSRVETVPGIVVPDKGVVSVTAARTGVLTDIFVKDGQWVERGEPIARIRSDEFIGGGERAADAVARGLGEQSAQILAQSESLGRAGDAERKRLLAEDEGARSEIAMLEPQIAIQQKMVRTAQEELEAATPYVKRGFVSRHDVLERTDALLTRQQALKQLQQSLAAKRAALAQISQSIDQNAARSASEIANLRAARSEVDQRRVGNEASSGYVLAASVSGMVTAVTGRVGQPLAADTSIASLIPQGSILRAEVYVAPNAIGFLTPGQDVRLSADAYPFQQFGTIKGHVVRAAAAPVLRQNEEAKQAPVYLVSVALDQPWVLAYGKRQPLIPGMSLSARIVTRKQSLIEWLFEPLFAVSKR